MPARCFVVGTSNAVLELWSLTNHHCCRTYWQQMEASAALSQVPRHFHTLQPGTCVILCRWLATDNSILWKIAIAKNTSNFLHIRPPLIDLNYNPLSEVRIYFLILMRWPTTMPYLRSMVRRESITRSSRSTIDNFTLLNSNPNIISCLSNIANVKVTFMQRN